MKIGQPAKASLESAGDGPEVIWGHAFTFESIIRSGPPVAELYRSKYNWGCGSGQCLLLLTSQMCSEQQHFRITLQGS